MTAPQHRRALPAVVFIGILTVLTAVVWVRVLNRGTGPSSADSSSCTTPAPATPNVVPFAKAVSVIVLNATNRANLASTTKKSLQKNGFRVVSAANDEPSYGGHGLLTGVGEIRFGPAVAGGATLLHYYFPGAKLVRTDSSSSTVVVALGQTYKALTGRTAVLAALRKADIRMSARPATAAPAPTPDC